MDHEPPPDLTRTENTVESPVVQPTSLARRLQATRDRACGHSAQPARMSPSADAIVVLGRGVRPDGSLGLIARARVDRALELFHLGVAPRIIFSGRSALMGDDNPAVTEAEAMATYATAKGLPKQAAFVEDQSRDTIGNAFFTWRHWLQPNDWRSVRVVT